MIAAFLWHFIPAAWLRSSGRRRCFAQGVFAHAFAYYERKAGRA